MDPATLVGIVLAFGALLVTMILEGTSPMAIVLLPPLILVFGGTFGAAMAGSAMADVKKIGGWFKKALHAAEGAADRRPHRHAGQLAEKARKEGLLALEAQVKDVEDPFLKRGLQMAIDGTDPEELRDILEGEITPRGPRTRSPPSSSRTWAATRRPSASSAPSSAWSTCWRTSPTRRRSAP